MTTTPCLPRALPVLGATLLGHSCGAPTGTVVAATAEPDRYGRPLLAAAPTASGTSISLGAFPRFGDIVRPVAGSCDNPGLATSRIWLAAILQNLVREARGDAVHFRGTGPVRHGSRHARRGRRKRGIDPTPPVGRDSGRLGRQDARGRPIGGGRRLGIDPIRRGAHGGARGSARTVAGTGARVRKAAIGVRVGCAHGGCNPAKSRGRRLADCRLCQEAAIRNSVSGRPHRHPPRRRAAALRPRSPA